MKHNFAALSMYSWGIPCARNGQERFRTVPGSRGLCALLACSGIFWLSSTKSSAAENMTGTRNKDDLQETEGQEDLHTNRSTCPMTAAGKQVQRRTCCGRIVCPQSAPPLACNMHDVRGPLVHFRDPFHNILNTASGVNGPQRGCEILQHVWAFILYFLACYVYGMLGYGAG